MNTHHQIVAARLPDPMDPAYQSTGQLGQDVVILDYLRQFGEGLPSTFADIGAFDGVTFSNTRMLQQLGFKGLLVEASPEATVSLLKATKPHPDCTVVHGTVAFEHGLHGWYDAPLVGSTAVAHKDKWKAQQAFQHLFTATITPSDIARLLGTLGMPTPTVLSVDLEGITWQFLKHFLPLIGPVKLAVAEIDHDQKDGLEHLLNAFRAVKMRHVATLEWDAIFVHESDPWQGPTPEVVDRALAKYRACR